MCRWIISFHYVFSNAGFWFCFWIKMMQPSLVVVMILSSYFSTPLLKFCMNALLVCIRLFLCSVDKSLGIHLAQTCLIQMSSVRILKTEDLLHHLLMQLLFTSYNCPFDRCFPRVYTELNDGALFHAICRRRFFWRFQDMFLP